MWWQKIQIFFNSFHSKPEILSGGISQDKNLSKHPIILGTGLKMTVISTDFPQNLSDHMPEKSDPIGHNGKQNVLVYHTRQNLLKFPQGAEGNATVDNANVLGSKVAHRAVQVQVSLAFWVEVRWTGPFWYSRHWLYIDVYAYILFDGRRWLEIRLMFVFV